MLKIFEILFLPNKRAYIKQTVNARKSGYFPKSCSCISPVIDMVALLITPPKSESTYPLQALATEAAPMNNK